MSSQQTTSTRRSLTGYVTKLVGDGATYGFINEEIFFPQTNVTGGPASVGDQVFAECEYSAHLPIKWNATSVKILSKTSGQHQGGGGGGGSNPILDQQPQQDIMLQQQQFNSTNSSVAVTYQQHRQQKQQQRQLLDGTQETNISTSRQQIETGKLLNPVHATNSSDYYGQADNRGVFTQQQQQTQDSNIQPFQDQTPMGPPNFTYTSQLGSAFVQNQFVPAPFLSQPPPSMLPQQQQPQHILPNNQMHNNQRNNHQQQQHNKGSMNNRYSNNNNQGGGDKNDRHMNNRRNNRNDNKFDRPQSGERDLNQGNRSSKSRGSRERSIGRTSKREEASRLSPPSHSSARSNSINSDRGSKSKRHYDVQNIPRSRLMLDMNAYNMKQRCPSFLHVPSDLKDIIVNKHFRLDIKNTPKPIKFIIEEVKEETETMVKETTDTTKEPQTSEESLTKDGEVLETKEVSSDEAKEVDPIKDDQAVDVKADKKEVKLEKPIESNITPPSSKSDIKLNHKYCVKVIILSIPDMQSIYHSVFGTDLDSYSEGKTYSKLDETISLLCLKGTNNGYSLIGGKFDPTIDGFIEGETNEFERHGRQPDLIATCKRVVLETTGLDLGSCKNWSLLSTFIYNNRSDYFSSKASIEYSFIYMPQLWTMMSDKFDMNLINKQTLEKVEEASETNVDEEPKQTEAMSIDQEQPNREEPEVSEDVKEDEKVEDISPTQDPPVCETSIEQLSELKVTDLKAELDRRNVKYKAGLKKAELVALLQETINSNKQKEEVESGNVEESTSEKVADEQLEEVKVEAASLPEDQPASENAKEGCDDVTISLKRKIDDGESLVEEPDNKKVCTNSPVKEKRIELITEPFVVRGRSDQPQLSLVSLYDTAKSRNDQFELLVTSTLLKESLTQHLCEYILTTLVEDHRQRTSSSSSASNESSSQNNQSSQESDTNNNSSSKQDSKNHTSSIDTKVVLKALPVDRYINLAFSYFDSTHMGYVYFEDLNKLFNNTGLTISKRALLALLGDGDKFNYRALPDLSSKVPPTYVYEYPKQFRYLPGICSNSVEGDETSTVCSAKMVEHEGVLYDVGKLVQQVKDADTMRVNLVERFNYAIENSDKQLEEIHVLEVSQKSLGKAIKAQNDEICDLKRERDLIKKKLENIRKGVKGTVATLSDLIKDEK